MEPPHSFLGGTEECHSSESGWTMYIGSPIDDDEDNMDDCYDEETRADEAEVIESDDSMASDASSGPCHYNSLNHLQQKVEEDYDDEEAYCSDHKKGNEKKGNQIVEKNGEKKKIFMDNKSKDSVQGGKDSLKMRKIQWVGTTK